MERLDIVVERRATEQTDFGDIGRSVPWQTALALDALDHRAFFTADIGTRTTPQFDETGSDDLRLFQRSDFAAQDVENGGIFVAHVKIDALGLHCMGRNQRAFQHAMRIAFKVVPVLEGARLALVAIDRHQPRAGIGAHKAPFLARRKTRAAEPTQSGTRQRRDQRVRGHITGPDPVEQRISALRPVFMQCRVFRNDGVEVPFIGHLVEPPGFGMVHLAIADPRGGGCGATPHAGAANDTNPSRILCFGFQIGDQVFGSRHHAGERIADPDRQRRRALFTFAHNIEMVIERGDLIDLRLAQLHLMGQRMQMACGQAAIAVLNEVEIFDQQVAAPRSVPQCILNFNQRRLVELAALGQAARAPGSGHLMHVHAQSLLAHHA